MNKFFEKYMLIIGCVGQLLYYMQAYKIFSDKSAGDVSLTAFLFGLVSVSSWLIYGVLLKNRVLIISNIFAVAGSLLTITGILIYS
jgi:MtN3 and saliva related transmembrane protein